MLRKVDITCEAVALDKILKTFLVCFCLFLKGTHIPSVKNDPEMLGNLKFSASSLSPVSLESYDSTLF